MRITPKSQTLAILLATGAAAMAPGALAQSQNAGEGEVLTTVYGAVPADLSELVEGPEVAGFISARNANKVRVTTANGESTIVTLSEGTEIKATGGFLGLGRQKLEAAALLNGLVVEVETVEWAGQLVARQIRFKGKDLRTAQMIRTGTQQQFGEQGAAITKNAAATEALRGRLGDIDKYNIVGTTNVYFDVNKFALSPAAQAELCSAAREAEATENALLLVVGYTDSTGSYELNQELSEKRAARVINFLQQECGWKPYRMLTPTGMAAADPQADNSTPAGRAQNRRVAVNVLVSKSLDGL
jgi:outer membrane protein OmpA-like peptidoglycan-associated protein